MTRKKKQQGLEDNLLFLASLLHSIDDAIAVLSPGGIVLYWNNACENVYGYSSKEMLGKSIQCVSLKEQQDEIPAALLKINNKVDVEAFFTVIKKKNGELIDVNLSISSVNDQNGTILGASVTTRYPNVGQEEMNHYSRSIIEANLEPLVVINPRGKITDVNESMVKITGVKRKNLIGSEFCNYFTESQAAQEFYQLVFSKGDVKDYPLTIKHASGQITDMLYNAAIYKDIHENILGIAATAHDITQQKQKALLTRALIESSLDPLISISLKGIVKDVNTAMIRMTGLKKEDLIDSNFSDHFTAPDAAAAVLENVLLQGFVTDHPLAIKNSNGRITDILFNASVYKDQQGNILKICAAARDFTKQKEISQYARSLIEASLDPLLTISSKGEITDVNEATVQVTGITRDKLIGSDFLNYFTEPDEAREGYQQVFEEGFVRDYPLAIQHVSGNVTDVLYNASIYRDATGNVLGVFAAARDITQRKRAEEQAHEAAAYSRSLIESSLDPLITINPDGKITAANHATEIITGVTKEWLIGSDFTTYFTEPKKARAGYRLVLKEGLVRDFPLAILHTSGKIIDVLYNATVFRDAHGKVQGIFAAARDITETKKTSQYARTLIEASLDPFVMMNPAGFITDVNEATIKVTGLTREQLIDTNFAKYFTEPKKATAGYEEVFLKGFITDYPLTLRHLNGKLTDVLYNASVYKDSDGEVIGIFATARDYTIAKKVTRELEQVNKELDAFTYSVAHDLKSPLRAIDGYSQILLADFGTKLDAEGHRIIKTITQNTAKMGRLIEDLLVLSHLGKSELKKEYINMRALVDSVCEDLISITKNREINIRVHELEDCKVDPQLIHQVWFNLVNNAIKFTQTKKNAIIEIGCVPNEDNSITYYIKDNGLGFNMRYVDKLFGVFQRLHGSEIEGTGIGLANVKRIITRHNGIAWGKGVIGEGATFSFTLPKE